MMSISWKMRHSVCLTLMFTVFTVLPWAGPARALDTLPPGGSLPLLFVENIGQFPAAGDSEPTRFLVQGDQTNLRLTDQALWFTHLAAPNDPTASDSPQRGLNLRLGFTDANPHPRLEPFNRLDTHVSYFRGHDPAQWHSDVPVWGGVRYVDIYPNLDLELTGDQGQLVQRWVVKSDVAGLSASKHDTDATSVSSNSPLSNVRLHVDGAESLALDDANHLHLSTALGDVPLPLPQPVDANGAALTLPARPEINGLEIVAPFAEGVSSPSDLVGAAAVDDLLFSSYLGGSDSEDSRGVAVDGAGSVYVTGRTNSADFPTTPGAFDDSANGSFDTYVAKLNSAGTALEYATYLGGAGDEASYDLVVDQAGQAYVSGSTPSADFPVTPGAYQTTIGGTDAFVTKLNATGASLLYSTLFGGSSTDQAYGLAVDEAGAVYLTGFTTSADLPTTSGAFQPVAGGSNDSFVAKFNTDGSALVYSTYLGGDGLDEAWDIAVDSAGSAYVTGNTESANFPVTPGAFQTGFGRLFVTKLNPGGSDLVYSTFLGGNGSDEAWAIAVDEAGQAFVAGDTTSTNFPTTPGAFQPTYHNGGSVTREGDAFVVKFNAAGSDLIYGTYLGGTDHDLGFALDIDSQGQAYVTGSTYSSDFPTTPTSFQPVRSGYPDAYLAKLNAVGSELVYGTFLGGSRSEEGFAVVADDLGQAIVSGRTSSPDFPTSDNAFDPTYGGSPEDAFVTQLATGNESEPPTPTPEPVPAHTCAPTALGTITVGNEPRGLAVDSLRERVYVANYGSNSVSVIDSRTNTVLQTIEGITAATGISHDPQHNVIWVTNSSTNQVTPIQANAEATTFTVLPAIAVGESPWGVTYDPVHDYIFVANSLSDSVTVIDAASRAVVTTLSGSFQRPFHLAANPVTGKVYVVNSGPANSVAVLEGASVSRVVSLYDSQEPYGLAIDETRNLVYIATVKAHRIVVIGSANGQPDQFLGWAAFNRGFGNPNRPVPMRMLAVNPTIGPAGDGGHLWATTTADGSEANQALLIPKGWTSYFNQPFAQDVDAYPADGIAIDRVTNRVYIASGSAPGSVTVIGDHATLCADVWAKIASDEPSQPSSDPDDARIGVEIFRAEEIDAQAGDINKDGKVNLLDLVTAAALFGSDAPEADVNQDGTVDVIDLTIIAGSFRP
ncbi:MAG: SBBP repeat-containing protein [Anaerolineales bacterium]|nr:SBBP repeat-containing protein [Anaerolineales bacterium]